MSSQVRNLEGLQILIVEDSQTQALMLKEMLEKEKMHVRHAPDGVDALQMMKQLRPQLVISDIEMPRMNGFDFCRYVKTSDSLKDIPVIMLTNLTDSMDVIKGIECGADSFLTKPCDTKFLLSSIENAVQNRQVVKKEGITGQLEFYFAGQKHQLQINPGQVMELLLSTYSNAIQKNLELEEHYRKLNVINEELEKKNEELKKLNIEKNQFLGMAAHDLRNPLYVISGYSDWMIDMLKPKLDEESFKMLLSIKNSSAFMFQLINDLLNISAIENGTVSLTIAEADLAKVIQDNVDLQKNLAEKKQIQISFESNEHPKVFCDVNKITEVLNNLIGNAIKFCKAGSGKVSVSLQSSNEGVTIKVQDNGVGIPLKAQEHLFKPFSKSSTTGTSGEKGTGLGLAIVHKIVEAHKGKIWFESEEGKGTTFFITLPYKA